MGGLIMKYPIRVLQVVTYMGRGGLETMLMNYYRHIDHSKVQFDFLTHREFDGDYDKEIKDLGGNVYHLSNLNPLSTSYKKSLNDFFENHPEYKIVHSHLDCMAGIPLKYAKLNHVPLRIAHAHNSNQTKDLKYLVKLFYKRNIKKNANYLFACGDEAGKWMFNTNNFKVLNNAINARDYTFNINIRNDKRKEFCISDDSILVGHVGRFFPQKNHEFLIDIFYEIHKMDKNTELLLFGDGPLRQNIEIKVKNLKLESNVKFMGIKQNINEYMQAMDIFLLPSFYEGLPVVGVEAQTSGLSCIFSTNVTEEAKLIEDTIYIDLDKGAKYWAEQALQFKETQRKDKSSLIAERGFDIKKEARKLQNYYLNLLGKEYGTN